MGRVVVVTPTLQRPPGTIQGRGGAVADRRWEPLGLLVFMLFLMSYAFLSVLLFFVFSVFSYCKTVQ